MNRTPSKILATKLATYKRQLVLTSVTISAAQAHNLHMLSFQYSVLDHRPGYLSVQPPPHTLDQLAAVVLLPGAVGGKMA